MKEDSFLGSTLMPTAAHRHTMRIEGVGPPGNFVDRTLNNRIAQSRLAFGNSFVVILTIVESGKLSSWAVPRTDLGVKRELKLQRR